MEGINGVNRANDKAAIKMLIEKGFFEFIDDSSYPGHSTFMTREIVDFIINDEKLALAVVSQNPSRWFKMIPREIKNYREIALALVKKDGISIGQVPLDIRYEDREIVLAAVRQNGYALNSVPEEIWIKDKEIIFEAIKKSIYFLTRIDRDLLLDNNREIFFIAVQEHSFEDVLRCYTELFNSNKLLSELKKTLDRDFILALVNQDGNALQLASNELIENDREIVLAAIRQNSNALQYVPERFIDSEIVLAAVRQNGNALQYVPERFIDREIVLAAVRQNGYALQYVPERFIDRETVLAAVRQNGNALQYVPDHFMDREIVLAAVRQYGNALRQIMTNDREIILAAVRQDGNALQHVPKEFLVDREIILAAVRQNGYALQYVPEEIKIKDINIVLTAVEHGGLGLNFFGDNFLLQLSIRVNPEFFISLIDTFFDDFIKGEFSNEKCIDFFNPIRNISTEEIKEIFKDKKTRLKLLLLNPGFLFRYNNELNRDDIYLKYIVDGFEEEAQINGVLRYLRAMFKTKSNPSSSEAPGLAYSIGKLFFSEPGEDFSIIRLEQQITQEHQRGGEAIKFKDMCFCELFYIFYSIVLKSSPKEDMEINVRAFCSLVFGTNGAMLDAFLASRNIRSFLEVFYTMQEQSLDKEFFESIKKYPGIYMFLPDENKMNLDVIKVAMGIGKDGMGNDVCTNPRIFLYLPSVLQNRRDLFCEAIKEDPSILLDLSFEFFNERPHLLSEVFAIYEKLDCEQIESDYKELQRQSEELELQSQNYLAGREGEAEANYQKEIEKLPVELLEEIEKVKNKIVKAERETRLIDNVNSLCLKLLVDGKGKGLAVSRDTSTQDIDKVREKIKSWVDSILNRNKRNKAIFKGLGNEYIGKYLNTVDLANIGATTMSRSGRERVLSGGFHQVRENHNLKVRVGLLIDNMKINVRELEFIGRQKRKIGIDIKNVLDRIADNCSVSEIDLRNSEKLGAFRENYKLMLSIVNKLKESADTKIVFSPKFYKYFKEMDGIIYEELIDNRGQYLMVSKDQYVITKEDLASLDIRKEVDRWLDIEQEKVQEQVKAKVASSSLVGLDQQGGEKIGTPAKGIDGKADSVAVKLAGLSKDNRGDESEKRPRSFK